jgi:DNA polymerase-3 subunit epsilon
VRVDRRLLLAIGGAGLALALWMLLAGALIWSTLEDPQRDMLREVLGPRLPLVALAWVIAMAGLAGVMRALYLRFARAPARLLESARILLAAPDAPPRVEAGGSAELQALGRTIGELAAQRDALRRDVAEQVQEASRNVQQERNRLAALMSELTQSVVVCNLDGRILLYNSRARLQFKALSQSPQLAGGAELIGIGRSIYTVFDRSLLAHALDNIRERMARGAASPSTQFITTTRAGQLLRVQMAPVRSEESDGGAAAIGGFVMMLDNVTRSFEEEHLRDQLLHGLTEGSRSSLANIQAALDMLALPDVEPPMRERFLGVVREEVAAMSRRIAEMAQRAAQGVKTRWPLEDMLGADLVGAARRRIESLCARPVSVDDVDRNLWLRVDSFSLLQALSSLALRLVEEFDVRFLQLRLQPAGERAQLDLIWSGQAMSTETVMTWEAEPMRFESQSTPLSVRDVVERHGGEMWFERDRVRHQAFFRFLLPLAGETEAPEVSSALREGSRPEYYDFDLFRIDADTRALDDRPLSALAYTVFDTETTGLAPADGDQIIQIGAARVVNGRLLRSECFEQLVDPGRKISAASVAIHGITPDMVAQKPRIAEVLPAFHAFAQDTVLVAHNAAFDMKFLQLQEEATGVVFRQPVLDTLLLSAVVHPNQPSHRLEDIAQRFDVTVTGRHTALGDAMVTAEVLLRLIPLLEEKGVRTLREAREASQRTYYARLKY